MPAKQARSIVFTHNNYAEGDIAKLQAWDLVSYGCIGEEVGEGGTPHLQGYLKFAKRTSLKKIGDKLAELLGKRPHIEKAKSVKAAIDYCKKDGKVTEWGDMPKQGKRADLEAAFAAADSSKPMLEVAREHPSVFLRYSRGVEKVRQLHNAKVAEAWREVQCKVYTGPTGCGKTRLAMSIKCEDGREPYKIQGDQLTWWDGYEGESHIVIDEYANNVACTKMLGILDGYKLRLPIKGGFTYARWTHVIITTNLKRDELHPKAGEEHRKAFERRITGWQSWWAMADWHSQLEAAKASSSKRSLSAASTTDQAADDYAFYESMYGGFAQDIDGWQGGQPPKRQRLSVECTCDKLLCECE